MDRRTACLTLAALGAFAVTPARAQSVRPGRVAFASMDRPNPESPFLVAFRGGMQARGWVEGQNVVIDTWWANGSAERLKALVPDIVASRPDIIVAAGGPALRPFLDAGVSLPIAFTYSGDPVLGNVVKSWARPGVNRSGISLFSLDLLPKRIELTRDVVPAMKRVALVGWPPHAGEIQELEAARIATSRLGLQHRYFGTNTAAELDAALDAIGQWNADAVLVFAGGIAAAHPDRFAAFSLRRRIPTVSAWGVFAESGNLMTYGPVLRESYVRLASYADRVLKGAKLSDMPVEQPTTVELVLNQRTARAIGITFPPSVLLRADRVIE
jgi:putative ABC transport system substrate-binding protein